MCRYNKHCTTGCNKCQPLNQSNKTVVIPVSGTWGSITGVLSNQTDLQNALNGKANLAHTHDISNITNLQTALNNKLDKGSFVDTAQDLKNSIDGKANTDASNIDDNLHIWRQKIDAYYVHDQAQPSSIWTINHPLNKKVSVTITDTAGTVVEGQVIIKDNSQVIVTFNYPFSGIAVLN